MLQLKKNCIVHLGNTVAINLWCERLYGFITYQSSTIISFSIYLFFWFIFLLWLLVQEFRWWKRVNCALSVKSMKLGTVVDNHKTIQKILGGSLLKSKMAAKIQDGRHKSPFYKKSYSSYVNKNKLMKFDNIV